MTGQSWEERRKLSSAPTFARNVVVSTSEESVAVGGKCRKKGKTDSGKCEVVSETICTRRLLALPTGWISYYTSRRTVS